MNTHTFSPTNINGSVYFDVLKYNDKYNYGKLSGRIIEDLIANTRELDGQQEKRNQLDFALWKKAMPEHIMRWDSPWSVGFPGWHLECSAMGMKYLSEEFDIHGGGMDLMFPHHECEIAQSVAANGKESVKYWLHNNMITINGQKMGKSLNNFITLDEFFSGSHTALSQSFSPMTIRFFILQAHYRSTVDFSSDAFQAAEKGLKKLTTGYDTLYKITSSDKSTINFKEIIQNCYNAMNDDLNSPIVIANLFEAVRIINSIYDKKEFANEEDITLLKSLFDTFAINILGLEKEAGNSKNDDLVNNLMGLIIEMRKNAKQNKDFTTSDKIRDELTKFNIAIKDTKDGAVWNYEG